MNLATVVEVMPELLACGAYEAKREDGRGELVLAGR